MARATPLSREMLERFAMPMGNELKLADRPKKMGLPPSRYVKLPTGYRAEISFEEQPDGLCRHLSVSVDQLGALPSIHAVAMVASAFGFQSGRPVHLWMEEFAPGHNAINLLQFDEDCE
jgi:hypothetical protein